MTAPINTTLLVDYVDPNEANDEKEPQSSQSDMEADKHGKQAPRKKMKITQ